MRAFTIRIVLIAIVGFLFIPRSIAGADEPATPVAVTEVPSATPVATELASTPIATAPVATEESALAADTPIILTLNGVAASAFVKVGSTVTVDASPGGMWFFLYHGAGCQGDRFDFFKKSPFPFTSSEPAIGSVMAFDPNVDYLHPSGPCLNITWSAPTLLLNGSARDAYLTLDSELTAEALPGNMKINVFSGSGCDAQRLITVANSSFHVKQPEAGTASLQAFDPADPTNVSPCLDAIWDSFTPPAQPVELSLNGKRESITVFNNHPIAMETSPANLSLRIYDGPGCLGRPVVRQGPFHQMQSTPTTQSAQAFDPKHPANPSACLNLTWRTPDIAISVNSWIVGDRQGYQPGVPIDAYYYSEDSTVTILGRFYSGANCGTWPGETLVAELPAALTYMSIEHLFADHSTPKSWSLQGYDPVTGQVSRCVSIHEGRFGATPAATPEAPVTAEPSIPSPSPSAAVVTTLPNTGDGPPGTQSATGILPAVSILLGVLVGNIALLRIRRLAVP